MSGLTDEERRQFEQIEDTEDTQGLAWRVNEVVVRHVSVAERKISAAEDLHKPVRLHPEFRFQPWCGECSQGFYPPGGDDGGVTKRRVRWPCATALALEMVDPLADTAEDSSIKKPSSLVD